MCKLPEGNTNISVSSFAYGLVGTGLLSAMKATINAGSYVVDERRAELEAFSSGATATFPAWTIAHTPTP